MPTMRGVLPAAVMLGIVVISATSVASAQRGGSSGAELDEARARFMAGQAAVESGRWADAVEDFSRAYQLSEVGAALYNLGFALRALGRHTEARGAFDELLSDHPRLDRQMRRDARRYRAEAQARVATLRIDGLDQVTRHTIRFDGREVEDDGSRPVQIDADAGTHALTVRVAGFQPFVWEGELEDGQGLRVTVQLVPATGDGGGGGDAFLGGGGGGGMTDPDDGEGGILSSPVFWLVVGAVVLGAGVVVGYVVHDGLQLEGNSERMYEL